MPAMTMTVPHHDTTTDATVPAHAADRLLAAIDRLRAPVCVGIDPVLERLPAAVRADRGVDAIGRFVTDLLAAIAGRVPCVKFQSACFERYGADGVATLHDGISRARALGFEVILDAKRGDIGISAEHYAAAAFDSAGADWLTANAYLGPDGLEPFLRPGHGTFALVRTSNPGGDELQGAALAAGGTIAEGVAAMIAALGAKHVGERGYSSLGAVVGATKAADAVALRECMPHQIFLVPGYGAQGGGADDVLACFRPDGTGAIITASRSVIYAFDPASTTWIDEVAAAADRFAAEIRSALGQG
jgi:orotidine-5'-phosphate decarboxylase